MTNLIEVWPGSKRVDPTEGTADTAGGLSQASGEATQNPEKLNESQREEIIHDKNFSSGLGTTDTKATS